MLQEFVCFQTKDYLEKEWSAAVKVRINYASSVESKCVKVRRKSNVEKLTALAPHVTPDPALQAFPLIPRITLCKTESPKPHHALIQNNWQIIFGSRIQK